MKNSMMALVLILLVFISILQTSESRCVFGEVVYVEVTNNLPLKSPVLTLHCQSKDDDLGYHNLTTNKDFDWSFCEHALGRTLFFCHLWWGSRQKSFDVYHGKFPIGSQLTNYWSARSEGLFFSKSNKTDHYVKNVHLIRQRFSSSALEESSERIVDGGGATAHQATNTSVVVVGHERGNDTFSSSHGVAGDDMFNSIHGLNLFYPELRQPGRLRKKLPSIRTPSQKA
ncbi:plant self-incompatibility protein S1 family [Striga asiatica]|uniref:S-protein homolog n=1 Tax=Striga asiatica TaxID=4170 RepID=A0A5A7RI78_STRAF|nr:plant self-incompatibility protein S1 family [Striga asiatica]